jgi:organic hydroperoxide reductase OsmC/OhrA
MLIENVLHCTHVKTAAGREIRAVFCDGVLDLTLSSPREQGRRNWRESNPEQLLASRDVAGFLGPCPGNSSC